jgi:hypothetical protein
MTVCIKLCPRKFYVKYTKRTTKKQMVKLCRGQLKCDGTRAEIRILLSAKRTSPFKLAGASVQSTAGSRGVRISGSNAGYTMYRGSVKSTGSHSIRQFPLHFPSRASPCAITFQLDSTSHRVTTVYNSRSPLSLRPLRLCCGAVTNRSATSYPFTVTVSVGFLSCGLRKLGFSQTLWCFHHAHFLENRW